MDSQAAAPAAGLVGAALTFGHCSGFASVPSSNQRTHPGCHRCAGALATRCVSGVQYVRVWCAGGVKTTKCVLSIDQRGGPLERHFVLLCPSVSGPRGSFGDGRAMRTAVASKFRQSAGDGTLRIGEMRGSHPCAWHSAAATCGAAVALSALASLLGDWGRSPQQAGACLTLWNEVPEENWPFLLKILAMSVMGAGDALAMSPPALI